MPDTRSIDVVLDDEQAAAIEAALARGEYATTGEIVREALKDWQAKRQRRAAAEERLGRLWDEGMASGDWQPLDIEAIIARARARREKLTGT